MPRGGARVGAGRKKKAAPRDHGSGLVEGTLPDGQEPLPEGFDSKKYSNPLDYMIDVMNNPTIDAGRRDRMAVAAAQYLVPKAGESGKKQDRAKAAEKAGRGRFAPSAPPKLRAVK